jgi:uncharacterized protein (DUF2249 family)
MTTLNSPAPGTHPAHAPVIELDVRDDLRNGREPFSRIMTVVSALQEQEVLHLRAIFEPVPLFKALGKRGFHHESIAHAPDDWSVWFWQPAAEITATTRPTVVLDVRGLEPPEPLTRTLAALETLPDGHELVQLNDRVPQLLFPMLAERGFACDVDESQADRVVVRIWRSA